MSVETTKIQGLVTSLKHAMELATMLRDEAAAREDTDPEWEDDYLIWDELTIDIDTALQRIGA